VTGDVANEEFSEAISEQHAGMTPLALACALNKLPLVKVLHRQCRFLFRTSFFYIGGDLGGQGERPPNNRWRDGGPFVRQYLENVIANCHSKRE